MISRIGKIVIDYFIWIKEVIFFFFDILYWIVFGPFKGKFAHRQSIFQQMIFIGVYSIVIVFFVNLFTGIVLAMQGAYQLEKMGAVLYVSSLVAVSACRELTPVLTEIGR